MADNQSTPNRKTAILAAAETVFAAHGYAATTIDAVAAKAGIAKGSVYNYFQSKEALFEQVFVNAVSTIEADAFRILSEPSSASERLSRFLDYRCERLEDCSHIGRLVLEFWATAAREQQGALAKTLREVFTRWRQRIADLLVEGANNGEFELQFDSPFGAALLLALLDGIEIEALLGFGPKLDEQYRAALKGSVLAALTARKTTKDKQLHGGSHDEESK